jgi:2-polyprenyl-6-methoxyphenol hydroxylase-like FAD-dependent oxidoreductase
VGGDAEATRRQLLERFGDTKIPCIVPLIERARDFFLWPVFTLSKEGKWSTDRVMLLGDAAVSSLLLLLLLSLPLSIPTHLPFRKK